MERTGVGIVIEDPAPDFATLARSFGWHATGPVIDPAQVAAEVRRAAEVVMTTGQPALVDIVCSPDE
jgi:benzoylformate decarboxylase/acetolactate synthase-1/2/3 large subunit